MLDHLTDANSELMPRTTGWRPRRPLRRGQTYFWQVTATLRDGSKVVASASSPLPALLRIVTQ